jgi:hypothetical protein
VGGDGQVFAQFQELVSVQPVVADAPQFFIAGVGAVAAVTGVAGVAGEYNCGGDGAAGGAEF